MKNTIYNNYYSTEAEDEARQFLFDERGEENGWNSIDDVPDDTVWDEIAFQNETNWEEEKHDLKKFFDADYFLVYGSFGSWRGRLPAGKVISSFGELSAAWDHCDYIHLYDENGHFHIECSHHDGTNYYEVKRLTNKGREYLSGFNLRDQKAHEKAFNCNLFTALPHYAHKVFGCKKYA